MSKPLYSDAPQDLTVRPTPPGSRCSSICVSLLSSLLYTLPMPNPRCTGNAAGSAGVCSRLYQLMTLQLTLVHLAGSTTCVSGSTCTYSNSYYSQCLCVLLIRDHLQFISTFCPGLAQQPVLWQRPPRRRPQSPQAPVLPPAQLQALHLQRAIHILDTRSVFLKV